MRKIKIKKINLVILTIGLSIVFSIFALTIISIRIKPILVETMGTELTKIESNIVNNALSEILKDGYDANELLNTTISKSGEIETIDFDSNKVNQLLNKLTMKVQEKLNSLEVGTIEDLGINNRNIYDINEKTRKGIVFELPIGVLSRNITLSSIGPRIPIKIHYLNDVNGNITTKIKEYGINNALMEIYANIEINAKIIFPFISEKIALTTSIPITIKMIQGKIPNYYGGGINKDSMIYSLPNE